MHPDVMQASEAEDEGLLTQAVIRLPLYFGCGGRWS